MTRRLTIILLSLLFCSLGGTGAHEGRPVYVEVSEQANDLVSLRWKIPPVMRDADIPMIRLVGDNCSFETGVPRPSLLGGHLYRCDARAKAVELRYPAGNPALSTLVMLTTREGQRQSSLSPPGKTLVLLPGDRSTLSVGRDYLEEGIRHILEGYDHLLFVLCLMFLARAPRRVVLTVTGFTIGHSITLAAAALGKLSLPPDIVEPLIAFSILLLAVEALKDDHSTLASRYPASVAAMFGLLHGLGFAGALSEIGLPDGFQLSALLFFNLGVEAGQLLFIALAFGSFRVIGRLSGQWRKATDYVMRRAAILYPCGIVAAFWTIERVTAVVA